MAQRAKPQKGRTEVVGSNPQVGTMTQGKISSNRKVGTSRGTV